MYLVGTVHHDPRGPERLTKLLRHYKPRSVSIDFVDTRVEANVFPTDSEIVAGVRFFDDLNAQLCRRITGYPNTYPNIKELLIAHICNEGYAYRTAMALKPELGYRLFFVADHRGNFLVENSRGDDTSFWKYVDRNASKLRQTPLPDLLAEMQRATDAVYDGNVISDLSPRFACFGKVGKEVEYYARLIRELIPEMHIGELYHMVHKDGLMTALADIKPTLIRLKEVDEL